MGSASMTHNCCGPIKTSACVLVVFHLQMSYKIQYFFSVYTVQNFQKGIIHLPSTLFAKTGVLFWPDFPRFRFFVYQGDANRKDWSK